MRQVDAEQVRSGIARTGADLRCSVGQATIKKEKKKEGNNMKKNEEEKTIIKLPKIKIKKARIKIVGDSPLIINRFTEKARAEILNKQLKKAKERPQKIPFQEFMQRLHWITPMPDIEGKTEEEMQELFEQALRDGARFGFPSVAIKQSAISSAFRGGLSKNKVSLQGLFHIEGDLVEIKGDLSMREDYVKIPMARSRRCLPWRICYWMDG